MNACMYPAYLSLLPAFSFRHIIHIIVSQLYLVQHFYINLHTFFIDGYTFLGYTENRLHRESKILFSN